MPASAEKPVCAATTPPARKPRPDTAPTQPSQRGYLRPNAMARPSTTSVAMAALGVVLYLVFKRRGWL